MVQSSLTSILVLHVALLLARWRNLGEHSYCDMPHFWVWGGWVAFPSPSPKLNRLHSFHAHLSAILWSLTCMTSNLLVSFKHCMWTINSSSKISRKVFFKHSYSWTYFSFMQILFQSLFSFHHSFSSTSIFWFVGAEMICKTGLF